MLLFLNNSCGSVCPTDGQEHLCDDCFNLKNLCDECLQHIKDTYDLMDYNNIIAAFLIAVIVGGIIGLLIVFVIKAREDIKYDRKIKIQENKCFRCKKLMDYEDLVCSSLNFIKDNDIVGLEDFLEAQLDFIREKDEEL